VRDDATGRRAGTIVEVEAYGGRDDRASHARFGPTVRNRVMAGPPGIAYVYLVYGMYDCLNVVCEPDGRPAAVLIRAVEPLAGIERMRNDRTRAATTRRRVAGSGAGLATATTRLAATPDHRLASGPGLVGAAYGIDTGWTGTDLCDPRSPLRLEPGTIVPDGDIAAGPRVGVAYAGEDWASRPWRFALVGHRSVSGRVPAR
jgi:DNA-3-methyladenine glycosylase